MVKALNSSEMKERMALQGMDPAPSTPAELTAFVKAESAKWAKVAKDSGATAE
jgi:tripartite-type tricarboxylate transporter receptor subunit TctC